MKFVTLIILICLHLMSITQCGLLSTQCGNTIKSEVLSPDAKYIATVFERDCGATVDFSTMVNFRPASSEFNGEENIVFVVKGQPQISINWQDSLKVKLVCPECQKDHIFKQELSWNDIAVTY